MGETWAKTGHGTYTEISETKELLAAMHHETRFLKMQAEKTPYLCEKMLADPDGNVIIPTELLVNEGKVVYHVRGMEEIGGEEASPASPGSSWRSTASWRP